MTDEQVRDEALTLLTAGYETAASALTWTWYLLSLHPDVEARMHSEIDRVLGGRLPGFGDIDQLRYVGWVINESMRLYPPVWVVARRSTSPCRIGGYDFEPGTVFVLSPFVMHRHPEYFPAPEEFLPERWQGEPQHDRFAYFPFGGGPRYCIGDRFARTEAILAIATLGQKWKMRLAAKNSIALQPLVTLRPKGGLPMILQRRQAVAVSQ